MELSRESEQNQQTSNTTQCVSLLLVFGTHVITGPTAHLRILGKVIAKLRRALAYRKQSQPLFGHCVLMIPFKKVASIGQDANWPNSGYLSHHRAVAVSVNALLCTQQSTEKVLGILYVEARFTNISLLWNFVLTRSHWDGTGGHDSKSLALVMDGQSS
jgi:hypothetical protein